MGEQKVDIKIQALVQRVAEDGCKAEDPENDENRPEQHGENIA